MIKTVVWTIFPYTFGWVHFQLYWGAPLFSSLYAPYHNVKRKTIGLDYYVVSEQIHI